MSIKLSKNHGVNPSITCCKLCGGEIGIAFLDKLPNDEEAPTKIIIDDICDDCKKEFDNGFIFIIELLEDGTKTGKGVFVPREILNIEIEGNYAVMQTEIFSEMFQS